MMDIKNKLRLNSRSWAYNKAKLINNFNKVVNNSEGINQNFNNRLINNNKN